MCLRLHNIVGKSMDIGVFVGRFMFTLSINRIFIILAFLVWANNSVADEIPRMPFNHLKNPDIESLDGIFAIAQDKFGFMWFGGKNGLRRYDGNRVDTFRHNADDSTSIASNDVSDIFVDSQGRLWVALLSGGGLNQFDYETQTFIHYRKNKTDANSIGSADIYALAEDERGDLWMATNDNGLNRLNHETGHFQRYPILLPGTKDPGVRDIAMDSNGYIWAATNSHGLYRINKTRDEFKHYSHHVGSPISLSEDSLFDVYVDGYDNVWVGTVSGGLNRLDRASGGFVHYENEHNNSYTLGSGMVWDMSEDANGDLWVASAGGVSRYSQSKDVFVQVPKNSYGMNTLSDKTITMFLDRVGDFWFGGQLSTIDRTSERGAKFSVMNHSPEIDNSLGSSFVKTLGQDSKGNIWAGSASGLTKINAEGNIFTRYLAPVSEQNPRDGLDIRTLMIDRFDRVWMDTPQGLRLYEPKDGQLVAIPDILTDAIGNSIIHAILEDSDGIVWIATERRGLISYEPISKTIRSYIPSVSDSTSLSHIFVWSLFEDKKGNLWVGSLWGLNILNKEDGSFRHFYHESDNQYSLSNNSVRAITEDAKGNIWLGTNSGLSTYDPITNSFEAYSVTDGLLDDNITSVLVDGRGNIWVTSQKGVSKFNPGTKQFTNYDKRHGISNNSYPGKAASIVKSNGVLLFSGSNGITSINPLSTSKNRVIPDIVLTDFYINNNSENPGINRVLERHISSTESLTLSHVQKSFSIEFASLNYHIPSLNQYQYKLVGFDSQWQLGSHQQRRATYTNLNPGKYTFLVKGSNNDGVWNETPVQLKIQILEPWWFSTWAIAGYYLLLLLTIVFAVSTKQKQSVLSTGIRKKLKKSNQLSQQFLKNISQEISIPINTIMGLSENLLDERTNTLTDKTRQHILLIHENSHQLGLLTQSIQDFSSNTQFQRDLNLRPLYLQPILTGVIKWFEPMAESKSLKLYLTVEGDLPEIQADYSCIQKILFNTIDNAIRHTEHGYVDVIAQYTEGSIFIKIVDTGPGIESNRFENIFSELETNNNGETVGGLANAKQLIEEHGGTIYIDSTSDKGSVFVIQLPINGQDSSSSEVEYVSRGDV